MSEAYSQGGRVTHLVPGLETCYQYYYSIILSLWARTTVKTPADQL
jgi:hypothetical protein